jgi:hypothetical protein
MVFHWFTGTNQTVKVERNRGVKYPLGRRRLSDLHRKIVPAGSWPGAYAETNKAKFNLIPNAPAGILASVLLC